MGSWFITQLDAHVDTAEPFTYGILTRAYYVCTDETSETAGWNCTHLSVIFMHAMQVAKLSL